MRIAILSDIHGNLAALEAVARDLEGRGVDQVVTLGDHLSGPLRPAETADFLMAQGWIHIAGNHERQLLDASPASQGPSDACARALLGAGHLAWVASLPSTQSLGGEVLLCHGTPGRDDEHLLARVDASGIRDAEPGEVEARLEGVGASLIACGHTHRPASLRIAGGRLVLNPGSVGLQAYRDIRPHPYIVETGSPEARYALAERRNGAWSAELVRVPYDVEAMADLAEARGFGHWVEPLRRGLFQALPSGVQS